MSVAARAAGQQFETVLKPAWDLVEIHKRNPNQGLRVADLSLNRGAVVFAVAAWQTYVEQLTLAILDALAPPAGDPTIGVYRLLAANVRYQVKRLNVPNGGKTVDLLATVNFDPQPAWNYSFDWERQRSARHGSVRETRTVNPQQAWEELDSWVNVRHAIAHGVELPQDRRYRDLITGKEKGKPRLLRRNADRCLNFFEQVVAATGAEAERQFP